MSTTARTARTAEPLHAAALPGVHWLLEGNRAAYAAIAFAVVLRAALVLSTDFPLNDGGLFLVMTREIQEAGYRLPSVTAYNNAGIPFAYSPAAFYLTAAINSLTGIPLPQLFRFVPLLATSLLVVAFYRLASAMVRDRTAVVAAVLAFAVTPRSFSWLLMGGGLTRSLGLLAAVVALHQVFLLYTRREWRYAPTAALACALTVLTHLSTATFLAFSIALFFAFYGRHWHGVLSSAAVLAGTVLGSAIWWVPVLSEHGLAPFEAARSTSGTVFTDLDSRYTAIIRLAQFNLETTGEPLFPLVAFLAVLGSFTALRPGRLILPVWWGVIILLDTRAGPTYGSIPAAMLAGYGVVDLLVPALRSLYTGAAAREPGAPRLLRFVPPLVLASLLLFGTASALSRSPDYGAGDGPGLVALTPGDRHAMQWVAEHTPPGSRFIVMGGQPWHLDRVGEWFPALTARTSVNTVQGAEWRPGFNARVEEVLALRQQCSTADGACLDRWARETGQQFSHVYVWKGERPPLACCDPLIAALRHDPAYRVIYDGPGALVAERGASTPQP